MGFEVESDCRFISINFSTEPYLIEIGNHVTITQNVFFTTHDGSVWFLEKNFQKSNSLEKLKLEIMFLLE
jgi:hypothetical protein